MTAVAHELPNAEPGEGDGIHTPVAALFESQCAFVWRTLRHLGVDEGAVDDAVQDVFVIAHRRWSSFEGRSSGRTWLFGIARRVAYRHRRSANARRARLVPVSETGPEPAHEPFARVQAVQSLARLLGRLDRDKRAVFVLTELEGMTAPEVSDALGIPLGTVYSRSRAAWKSLGREASRDEQRVRLQLSVAREAAPSTAQQRRIWALVAARLPALSTPISIGVAKVVATGAWTVSIKAWVIGGAIAAGILGARLLMSAGEPEATGSSSAPLVGDRSPETIAPTPKQPPITSAPPAPARPREAEHGRAEPPGRDGSEPAARGRAPAIVDSPPPSSADALAQELALVRAAQRSLGEKRFAPALGELDEHARRFPRGQLTEDRRTLRLTALCALGRHADAEREAAALGREPATACD